MTLTVTHLTKHYAGTPHPVLEDASFAVTSGSLTCLLGPSGAGKTTLLHIIAGLVDSDSGSLDLDGTDLMGVPPHRRPLTLLMQQPRLFAHLDVVDNVAFGLRVRGVGRRERRRESLEMLSLVGAPHLAHRSVSQLSGGEQQRVALARALVTEPSLLLADEPFASVDQAARLELQELLARLQGELTTTILMVTHDAAEADRIASRRLHLHARKVTELP